MANTACWVQTQLPIEMVDILVKDIKRIEAENFLINSKVLEGETSNVDRKIRNSRNSWIPATHWIGGLLMHYVERVNEENFLYDISSIENKKIQYSEYTKDNFYTWHKDQDIDTIELSDKEVRKLSFTLQLSSSDDYTGGDVQFYSHDRNSSFMAPRNRGALIIFDSRTVHRVRKIKSGVRKSLVGWIVGPRWK
jgi:PKHD-type hydroxylase